MQNPEESVSENKYGVLFPGCGIRFLGDECIRLADNGYNVDTLVNRARSVCSIDSRVFRECNDGNFTNELQSQFAVYIYSCAMSDILEKRIVTQCCAGYSMGIYAALYHAQAIQFEDGLRLIEVAYRSLLEIMKDLSCAVAVILGLKKEVITALIDKMRLSVEIINENNDITYVVSGQVDDIKMLVETAVEEGALKTSLLPLSVPYHSVKSRKVLPVFSRRIDGIKITPPAAAIYSCVNQLVLSTEEDVINEIKENLVTPINWLKTIQKMVGNNVFKFIECGPGESLLKNAKFIDGDFTINNMKILEDNRHLKFINENRDVWKQKKSGE